MDLDINLLKILILILVQLLSLSVALRLFIIYRNSYKEIKIGYTIGLLMFSLLFIFKLSIQIIFSIFMISLADADVSRIVEARDLFPSVVELIAISILYKITKDY